LALIIALRDSNSEAVITTLSEIKKNKDDPR